MTVPDTRHGSSASERKILRNGKVILQWRLVQLLGRGGYGDIYEALMAQESNSEEIRVALKIEPIAARKRAIVREHGILERLQSSRYFPTLYEFSQTDKYHLLAIELLGPSLSRVRRALPNQKFSMSTALRLGVEMLKAIRELHSLGFLHRDVKASNFLLRNDSEYPLALIDFGLAVQYADSTGEQIRQGGGGFVGTSKYASLGAHRGFELGRVDDLMSWFYTLIEFVMDLPWGGGTRTEILQSKLAADMSRLVRSQNLPEPLVTVWKLIRRCGVDDAPEYELIMSFVCAAMELSGATWDDPFDWEAPDFGELGPIRCAGMGPWRCPSDLPPPVFTPKEPPVRRMELAEGSGRKRR